MKIINSIKNYLFGLFLITVSCSKENDAISPILIGKGALVESSYAVTIDDVYHFLSDRAQTRSQSFRIDPVITGNDTTLYIINYENGWEILSSDTRAPRVFAQSDFGSISEKDLRSVPALALLYEQFISKIKFLKAHPDYSVQELFFEKWDSSSPKQRGQYNYKGNRSGVNEVVKNHLLQTKWGQGHPWNIRAPYTSINLQQHCLTGCGPVAMAQLLYYLHDNGGIQYSPFIDCYTYKYIPNNADYVCLEPGDVTFIPAMGNPNSVWDSMPLDSLCTGQSFEAVSTLMIDMGRVTNSRYYRLFTSTYAYELATSFISDFHMAINSEDVDFEYLSDLIIQNNIPAILLIGHVSPWVYWSNGHYVVADAMKEYYQENNGDLQGRYVGFNWGWDGQCDDIWLNTDIINWNILSYNFNSLYYMVYVPVFD